MIKEDYIRIRISSRDKEYIRTRAEALQMTMSEYIIYLVRRDAYETENEDKKSNG